jgi:hypothetical protein
MRTRIVAQSCLVVALSLLVGTATGQPVYFEGTGHYYERIDEELGWDEAKLAAEQLSYMGVNGYLVTIRSQAEQDFIEAFLLPSPGIAGSWTGGYQPPGSDEPAADWSWVTGEAWDFTNWTGEEPNQSGGYEEDFLEIQDDGGWNDLRSSQVLSYIVEYPVPEPSVLALSLLGVSGVVLRRRRRR